MRADAQRNYNRLLEEARQAFVVHGTEVALEDIARHAGVGIGTLYRHFPDRYTLMNAVFEREMDALTGRASELLTDDDPAAALIHWLRAVAWHSTAYQGLAAAIMENGGLRMPQCKTQLRAAGGSLLQRAQQEGAIRQDVDIADLLKLTCALVLAAEKNRDDGQLFDRLMSVAVEGMRPPRTGDASAQTAQDGDGVRGDGVRGDGTSGDRGEDVQLDVRPDAPADAPLTPGVV